MGTLAFFETILPASGIKILAELINIQGRDKPGWKYHKYDSLESMAAAVPQFEAKGRTVYHACHSYGDWYTDEAVNKKRIRTAKNVVACRALYDDIDTNKPGHYATKKEAFEAVKAFVATTGMPMPLLVDSGGGLHLYWPLHEDVTPQVWSDLSALKRRITKHLGLKADRAVDMDLARVLRPIGTLNDKYDPPRIVTRKNEGKVHSASYLRTVMEDYISANKVPEDNAAVKKSDNPFAMLLEREYPDSYPDIIAQHCAVVGWFKETGAPNDEPLWHKLLGLLKHAKGGEESAHEWSALYDGYSQGETQAKMDAWEHGPTLCSTFKTLTDKCTGCTHAKKTPLQLGYVEETKCELPPEPPVDMTAEEVPAKEMTKEELVKRLMPSGYSLSDKGVSASVRMPDETWQNVPICDTVFYPIDLTQGEDNEWNAVIEYRTQYGKLRRFSMPTSDISAPDKLCSSLAAHTIWIYNTKLARSCVSEYIRKFCVGLQAHKREVKTEQAFGWNEDLTGFVVGTSCITKSGVKPVLLSDNIQSGGMAKNYGRSGSRDEWVRLVDEIYNRPGAEAYQFAFLASAAAPLIKLAGIKGFHGIPVAYTGKGGRGKTKTCQMASGIWGDPEYFLQSSNPDGTTINAMIARVSIHRNLPWIMDELTGQEPKALGGMLYALSNGKPKDRLTSSGKFSSNGLEWDTITFLTGNYDITDLLFTLDRQMSDAVSVRCFEIKIPDNYNETVFAGMNAKELIDNGLQNNYGAIGEELIQFYMAKAPSIVRNIHKMRQKYVPNTADETRERFYIDLICFALVAGHIMKQLGLIKFDIGAIRDWAMDTVKELRRFRADKKYSDEDIVGHFLSGLQGKTIITKHIRDARMHSLEVPLEQLRGPACARVALEEKRFIVSAKALNDWCKENGQIPSVVRDTMDKMGYIVHAKGRDKVGGFVFRIGAGTNAAPGQSRCYELDFAKIYGHESDSSKPSASIVRLPVADASKSEKVA